MAGILVRMFRLRRRGIRPTPTDATHVDVVAVESVPALGEGRPVKVPAAEGYDPGLLGVIERMFSGLLLDHGIATDAGTARREVHVVAVGTHSEDGHPTPNDVDVLATIAGPRIYPLPNSPTGWGRSTRGEKFVIGLLTDPARPDGLIADAQGLGTDAFHDMTSTENETPAAGTRHPEK